jgi:hypothetical protein
VNAFQNHTASIPSPSVFQGHELLCCSFKGEFSEGRDVVEYDLIMTQALHFAAQMYQADPALDAATGLPNLPRASLL